MVKYIMILKAKNQVYRLIEAVQGYLKIDLFYLIKGESWLLLGKAIGLMASFALSLAWANWINKEIYGYYQYILSLVGVISVFSLPELGAAIIQATARNFEGSFVRGFKIQLKWGLLASLSCLAIAGYYWLKGNTNLPLAFLVIALFLPLFNASIIYLAFLWGKKLFNIQIRYDSTTQVVAALVIILTLFSIKTYLSDWPIYLLLLLIFAVYYAARTSLRFFFFLRTKSKFRPNSKEDPKTISFGKHLTFSGLADLVASNLDKILLFHYLGAVQLAIYSFATLIPEQLNSLLKQISNLTLPKFSLRSREEIRATLLKKFFYLAALIAVLALGYIIIAPFVYQFLFPKYLSSLPYSQIYVLSIIPLSFSIGAVLRAKMMIKEIYQIRIITPIVRALLFIVLIPMYGIWGAIFALLGTRVFIALLSLYFFRKI